MYILCMIYAIYREERDRKKKIKMIKIMLFKTICHTNNEVDKMNENAFAGDRC